MIELIFDKDSFKILSMFSISPGSGFKRSQIKEKTILNNVPLDNALSKLMKTKILKKENNIYRINFENENSKKILEIVSKQHKELKELPLNVYFLLIDLVDNLSTMKKTEIYLFGSYSKLVYREKSDVDIALLIPEEINLKQVDKISEKLEKNYGKRIEIHDFIRDDFYKNRNDPLVNDVLQNGIKLM